ncbi:MAG: ATP citrate lyase citrate-binding domain-containing protein [Candidatus Yanofskybacteria bacterium]|nr:ATP citrate lyase citrate-binding domain-containing protein [Candidatus Yanofskybacteria bacterium]
MKLLEYQGKELFQKYGIAVPKGELVRKGEALPNISFPFMLKSQVLAGDRGRQGGVLAVERAEDFERARAQLFQTAIGGNVPEMLLAEERILAKQELYVSLSFSTDTRSPVLSLSLRGGSGVAEAGVYAVNELWGLPDFFLREACQKSGIPMSSQLFSVIRLLWKLFSEEKALLCEINPLFVLEDGSCVAGDAKVILDDTVVNPEFRPYVELDGDLGILASGGGASMLNLDTLAHYGGKPANYVEYSGNPPASVVEELAIRVLSKPGLKGCWVIGGTANFTDIYETLTGFAQGLKKVHPKPNFPIVIRRDGLRREEAFKMLKELGEREGYNFHLLGPETEMAESAKILVDLAYVKP